MCKNRIKTGSETFDYLCTSDAKLIQIENKIESPEGNNQDKCTNTTKFADLNISDTNYTNITKILGTELVAPVVAEVGDHSDTLEAIEINKQDECAISETGLLGKRCHWIF